MNDLGSEGFCLFVCLFVFWLHHAAGGTLVPKCFSQVLTLSSIFHEPIRVAGEGVLLQLHLPPGGARPAGNAFSDKEQIAGAQ